MSQIVPVAQKAAQMRVFFEKRKNEIGAALARVGITPDRIIRALFTSAQKNPLLYDCTPESTYKAILLSAQGGLLPDGITQQAHLIPRRNTKKGVMECNLQIGYRGYLTLCRRSGDVDVIAAYVVRSGDTFSVKNGVPAHEPLTRNGFPCVTEADGTTERMVVGVWARAVFKSGAIDYEWMSRDELDAIRRRGQTGDKVTPWDTDFSEMAKKTVLRRLCKRLPQSEDAARLLELDAQAEGGAHQNLDEFDVPVPVDATVSNTPPEDNAKPGDSIEPEDDEFRKDLG